MRFTRSISFFAKAAMLLIFFSLAALPLHLAYVSTENMSRVKTNYDAALAYVNGAYKEAHMQASRGSKVAVPATSEEWIRNLNHRIQSAPGGGPAFGFGDGDAESGRIGVVAIGGFCPDARVLLERPAYGELDFRITVIAARDLARP